MPKRFALLLSLALLLTAGCTARRSPAPTPAPLALPPAATTLPRPDHVLIVVEENRAFEQIIGSPDNPYINELATQGALLLDYHALTHPSQPNYIALFSGATQGITDDSCPHTFTAPNLGAALIEHGFTFTGYSESMPKAGYTGCQDGAYRRKHNPWVDFGNVPVAANQPLSAFPADYAALPTVSFVIPDQSNDMHDGTAATADGWLKQHLSGYIEWAQAHNSLFILTFDEDDNNHHNRIVTLLIGPMVKPGSYGGAYNHYSLLRTLSDMYGLPAPGAAASTAAISMIWK